MFHIFREQYCFISCKVTLTGTAAVIGRQLTEELYTFWRILFLLSDPTDADSDDDFADDLVEKEAGSDPFSKDTDKDGLDDGKEIVIGFDSTSANADGDVHDDLSDFLLGFEPNSYDDDLGDWEFQFMEGFVKGDFIKDKTVANIVGQVTASMCPYTDKISDARDIIAAMLSGSKMDTFTNVIGAIPGQGDLIKGGKELSIFISKHADDFPKVAKAVEKITVKFPRIAKYIDVDAAEAAANGLKNTVKLSKRSIVQLEKTCKNAGKVVELNKNLDKTLELSQKVLDFSQKSEEFFDARDKDSSGSDGDDGDNDRNEEDDDPIAKAIERNKYKNIYQSPEFEEVLTNNVDGAFYIK
ncbi:hypothetical protein [Ruminococcus sp.]|uniref:hypothetical protein n=1 Tax=Ruminococcus sp. TaxID=41978 RepID=UPI0025F1A820|nr:hypothetical protein [Ruminococcus sp.]MBQ8967598.1 hypothetical protein [Ruminococcus sp.]